MWSDDKYHHDVIVQIIYVLMRAGRSCELGLPFPSTKEALRHAIVDRVQAGDGYFGIQPIQIMLVYSVNEKPGANQIIGLFIFEAVCSLEYVHAMNISHDELTGPLGLQQQVQEDHQAKLRAAQRGDGGPPRPQQIRAIMLERLDKLNDMKNMTPTGTHRDGGPFGIRLDPLPHRVSLSKWERFVLSSKSNSDKIHKRTNLNFVKITNKFEF